MNLQQRLAVGARTSGFNRIVMQSWTARAALAVGSLAAASLFQTHDALAVPAYARQTGQPCATCHTMWPELTPFGRQFKLMGYTSGGTRCNDGSAKSDETQVPLSVMAWPATFTSYKNKNANPTSPPNSINDNDWLPGQFSTFLAGQLYCDVGIFSQQTYDRPGNGFSWDLTDIKYAKTGVIDGTSIVYGITANNTPGVQDPWNTIQGGGYVFPWIVSEVAPAPGAAPFMTGLSGKVGSVGAYVWLDNSIYMEFTAYGALSSRLLTDLGDCCDPSRFSNAAPYWRLAYERTWDKNSLMFGTFGLYANQQLTNSGASAFNPTLVGPPNAIAMGPSDPTLDVGLDSQYQWIGEDHIFTVEASYIWENKSNAAEIAAAAAGGTPLPNRYDQLNSVNINATYIYDRTFSIGPGYFNTWGTTDAAIYGSSPNGKPNFAGEYLDLAYSPFMKGGAPDIWPWFNARIGILLTHYDVFSGTPGLAPSSSPTNGTFVKASGNDTAFFYVWLMF